MEMNVALVFVVLLHSSYLVAGMKHEAHCSKFHYEEQTLERMIRTELKFEELQKTVATSLQGMTTTLQNIQKTNDEFIKDQTKALADQISSTEKTIHGLQTISENFIEEKSIEFTQHKNEVEKMVSAWETTKDSALVPTIAFSARGVQDLTPNNGQTFVFTIVLYNHGDGYDSTTGVFTATVDGTYLFTTHLCSYDKKYSIHGIVVDNEYLLKGLIYDNGGAHPCSSTSAFAVLKSGQKVWIQGLRSGDQLAEDTYRWNMFSGALLHK